MEPFASETIVVGAVAVGLTAAVYAPAGERGARRATLTCEGGDVRWWAGGATPTSGTGHLAVSGDVIVLEGPNTLINFRAVKTDVGDGTLQVSYER